MAVEQGHIAHCAGYPLYDAAGSVWSTSTQNLTGTKVAHTTILIKEGFESRFGELDSSA